MIEPTKCPVCGDILVYEFGFDRTTKSCKRRLSHTFRVVLNEHSSLIIMSYKDLNTKLIISWNFVERKIFIGPYISIKGRSVGATTIAPVWDHKSTTVIPWFEPDIYDFPKLLKKIKTYICFS
ncbi:MAG: hypothetical protein WCT07_04010 [Candidatus Paceibacterota bacterium]